MHIDKYEFGRIVIDGQEYNHDVMIFSGDVNSPWWRKEGHYLVLDDLQKLLTSKPTKLIIGTGYSGMMSVDKTITEYCNKNSIEISVKDTKKAVEEFNQDPSSSAALHLTC